MRPSPRRARACARVVALLAALGGAARAAPLGAQCRPPASSHEARLLAFYAAPVAFSPATAPERMPAGAVRVGAEGAPVPVPDAALRQTSLCYQSSTQSTRLAPLFGRPRVTLGLPAGLTLEGSYLPPITVGGATPALLSLAVARTQPLPGSGGRALVALRVHGTAGTVRGAITCARDQLQMADPAAPCYGTRPSRDTFRPDMVGGEAVAAVRAWRDRVALYGGGGVTWERPRFQVGFTDAAGTTDATRVSVELRRGTLLGGVTARASRTLDLELQAYVVPADVTTWRLGAGYRLR
ncbi:MAG TPA: hypothetical protein VKA84_00430 [Gemmatimonadaceae bacterium]|nr:hypothetical protein [Gemmatimonadaceae bacterium]